MVSRQKFLPTSFAGSEPNATLDLPQSIFQTGKDPLFIEDNHWFRSQLERGCCPVAAKLYLFYYEKIGFRCCWDKVTKIRPLRLLSEWDWQNAGVLRNKTVLVLGDSLAQQHFIALVCSAWETAGHWYENLVQERGHGISQEVWAARIEPLGITLRFARCTIDRVPDYLTETIRSADFVAVSAWYTHYQHYLSGRANLTKQIPKILLHLDSARKARKEPFSTIVLPLLPAHFEGQRPQISGPCRQTPSNSNSWVVNSQLAKFASQMSFSFTDLAHTLLYERGDTHVEYMPAGFSSLAKNAAVDCVHYCVAPGVLTPLAAPLLQVLVENSVAHKRQLLYVHIGKSGGSSLGCRLNHTFGAKDYTCHHGQADPAALNSTLSHQVRTHVHQAWPRNANFFSAFLVLLRNPLQRTISQFYYSQVFSVAVLKERPMLARLHSCFKSVGELANGIITGGLPTDVRYSPQLPTQDQCIASARQLLAGQSNETGHFTFNIEFYARNLLKVWPRDILVLRSERLWGDYSRLDSFLGGSGVRPLDIHIRTFKTKNRTIDARGLSALCRLLCREIYYYKVLLLESQNLNVTEVRQSLEELEHTCPGSSLVPPILSQRFSRKPRLAEFAAFGFCAYHA